MNTKRKGYPLTEKNLQHMLNAMSRPKTPRPEPIKRTTLQVPESLAEQITDFRFDRRLPHWNDAVLALIQAGLEAQQAKATG